MSLRLYNSIALLRLLIFNIRKTMAHLTQYSPCTTWTTISNSKSSQTIVKTVKGHERKGKIDSFMQICVTKKLGCAVYRIRIRTHFRLSSEQKLQGGKFEGGYTKGPNMSRLHVLSPPIILNSIAILSLHPHQEKKHHQTHKHPQ